MVRSAPEAQSTSAGRHGRRQAHRFIYTYLATALIGCLAVAGFNYTVNPLNYYPPRVVKPLAWGDQFEKLDLLKTAPKPEVLILGSSRVSKLSPADVRAITGKTAFNAGVSSARPEEWYAMLRYSLEDLHAPIREVVLGIDMETLFYNGDPNEDLLSSAALRRYLPRELWLNSVWERSKLLLSWDQVQFAYKAIQKGREPAAPPSVTFDPDGYLNYVDSEKAVAADKFTLDTKYQVANYELRYSGASAFNPMRRQLFESLLTLAQAKGIRVRAFLPPFHPSVLTAMRKLETYSHVHDEMTRYAAELTARFPNVTIVDFSDVGAFGGDPTNFFDGVHYRQETARQIVTQLYRN